ncbi:Uma2 family endonuclease [Candidatus Poribacteria bacterium]|nr:Uma2 family endonuclease [Candidatus Poribacteria bacterium]
MSQATAVASRSLIGAQGQRTARSRKSTEILELFPRQGQWTEEAYLALPETNRIIELSKGRVVIPDMPTTAHQRAVGKLFRLMSDYVEAQGLGEVCVAPLKVHLWPGKFREPDIIFMHHDHADRIGEDYWGVPDLVVEVISPRTPKSSGTEQVDREEKSVEYARAGVQEYWLIHPTAGTVEVYVLRNGIYHLLERWGVGEVARSQVLEGFEVSVDAVIQGNT